MRILHITPGFQHPAVRGPHRHYHFLRELARAHQVTLLTLIRDHVADEALREVGAYTEQLVAFNVNGGGPKPAGGLVGQVPGVGGRFEKQLQVQGGVRDMRRALRRLAAGGRFDVVLFHGKSVYPAIDGWRGLPIVVDFCDATSMRLRTQLQRARPVAKPLWWLRYRQVRRLEQRLLDLTPHRAFISPRDRAAVLGADDRSPIVPNGVDLAYWHRRAPATDAPRIVFTGVMDYQPNADAARHLVEAILPRARRHIPGLEALIVGRNPAADLRERAAAAGGVTVTGYVDDMRPYLEQSAVFAAPLRYASGMQNKILEAMVMALPVLTTPAAAEGLKVDEAAPPVWIADDAAAAFADRLVALLRDDAARAELAAEGRRFVESRFDWSRSTARLAAMCEAAVAAR